MTVTLVRSDAKDCGADCPEWIAMNGEIVSETPPLLAAVLARIGGRHLPVLIASPGGAVEAALAMGRMIRARKLDVAVAGTTLTDCAKDDRACLQRLRAGERPGFVAAGSGPCASACVYVLAAGTDRVVGRGGDVGVHQIVSSRTVTRVINTFHILRKMVNGRPVEVKRMLVTTRPVVVKGAASDQTYAEVDRYLLGMGIDEAIMPMMRGTPPAGMHWMTPAELRSTRIATDISDAKSLVDRGRTQAAPAGLKTAATGLSAFAIDDGHQALGSATWRIETGSSDAPRLTADIDIPERHLTGHLVLSRSNGPGAASAFDAQVRLVSPDSGSTITEARPPMLCDPTICVMPLQPEPSPGPEGGHFAFGVPPARGDGFLSGLRSRDWLEIPVRTATGWHNLTLAITGPAGVRIETWERLCCSLSVSGGQPRATPVPPLPVPTKTAPGEPPPLRLLAQPTSTDGARVSYSVSLEGGEPPMSGLAAASWIPIADAGASHASAPPSLRTEISIPEADLLVVVRATPSERSDPGTLTFDIDAVADQKTFGPVSYLFVTPVSKPDKAVRLVSSERKGSGYTVDVAIDPSVSADAAVRFDMGDSAVRTIAVTIPLDEQVRSLAGSAGRARDVTH